MSLILCLQSINGNIEQANIYDVNRKDNIKTMLLIFIAALIIFGGFKGISAILSLVITFLLIVFVLIPLILNKTNPILATILVASISILINFILINGFSKKSLCDDNVQTLVTHTDIIIDYKGLLFSGMILGSMGAVMDIGMSITSFIFEMKKRNQISHPYLFSILE